MVSSNKWLALPEHKERFSDAIQFSQTAIMKKDTFDVTLEHEGYDSDGGM